jgi:ABC-type sugar transport system ATPase subunit
MVKVELRSVTRNYGVQLEETALAEDKGRPALENIQMTIEHGEIISIVGPSGCGKSTLLKIIAGLEFADKGQVLFNDYDVTRIEPQHRGVGMVFQDYALYPTMKGKGNLAYYFEVHQRTEQEMEQRTREIAEIMGVGFDLLIGQRTDTLSGGEQQRVAIGRCIVRDPYVFLMDEPISNLDAKLRERTRMEIKKMLRKFKVTTVYVTHDQQEAIFMGDRIAVMRKGKLEQFGTFDDLYYTPANLFVATFIGTPPMSVIPTRIVGSALQIEDAVLLPPPEIAAALTGCESVRLGMRAEGWETGSGALMTVRYIERIPTEQAAFAHGTLNNTSVTVILPLDTPDVKQIRVQPHWDSAYLFAADDETALHTPGVPDLF